MITDTYHYVLIDGVLNPNALQLLYAPDMAGEAIPLLVGTPHAPLADSGPLLASVPRDSLILDRWQHQQAPLNHAWLLSSHYPINEFAALWQRRLVMRAPHNRSVWLRFADARVIARGLEGDAFPPGFWQGTTTFQLPSQKMCSPIDASGNELPDEQSCSPFRLNERQLNALAANPTVQENS